MPSKISAHFIINPTNAKEIVEEINRLKLNKAVGGLIVY